MKIIALIALFAVLCIVSIGPASATAIVKLSNDPASPDWNVLSPAWSLLNKKLDGSGVSTLSPKIVSSSVFPSDRTFSVKFRTIIRGTQDWYTAWMVGKYVSEFNRTVVILHNSGVLELAASESGTTGLVDHIYTTSTALSNLDWHTLNVVYTGNVAQVSIDGKHYLAVTDPIIGSLGACHVELASWGNSESQFRSTTIKF